MSKEEIYDLIYKYSSKYKEGLMPDEIKDVIEQVVESGHQFNWDKYNDGMMGNTCTMHDEQFCMYHTDVYTAIICGVENRDMKIEEWD